VKVLVLFPKSRYCIYKQEKGEILINKQIINDINNSKWKKKIAIVPQKIKLFNGSLIYNICLTDDVKVQEYTKEYFKSTGIEKYFERYPQRYDTIVGNGCLALSGGQLQIIGLLRAIVIKPEILLIDELTAAMDYETEEQIIGLINQLKKKIGVIAIEHKSNLVKIADRVYKFQNSKLILNNEIENAIN
jgi:ATP-binding cassette, subfamily C, bacteriocin exporter